jgi:hypothetical protein
MQLEINRLVIMECSFRMWYHLQAHYRQIMEL